MSAARDAYMKVTRGENGGEDRTGWLPTVAGILRQVRQMNERLDEHDKRLDRIEGKLDDLGDALGRQMAEMWRPWRVFGRMRMRVEKYDLDEVQEGR